MILIYQNEEIFESAKQEELEKYKEKLIFEKEKKYTEILSKINESFEKAKYILNRNYHESDEAYLEKIKITNPEFIELVTQIGKELFDKDVEFFYLDIPKKLYGVKINDEYFTPMELSSICLKSIPKKSDFEIKL